MKGAKKSLSRNPLKSTTEEYRYILKYISDRSQKIISKYNISITEVGTTARNLNLIRGVALILFYYEYNF